MSSRFAPPPRANSSRQLNRSRSKTNLNSPRSPPSASAMASPVNSPRTSIPSPQANKKAQGGKSPNTRSSRRRSNFSSFASETVPENETKIFSSTVASPTGATVSTALEDIFGGLSTQPTGSATSRAAAPRSKGFGSAFQAETNTGRASLNLQSSPRNLDKRNVLLHAASENNVLNEDLRREVLGQPAKKKAFDFAVADSEPTASQPTAPTAPKGKKAEGKTIHKPRPPTEPMKNGDVVVEETDEATVTSERIDALEIMHQGTQFLKYGSFGFPHFRHFHLTADNTALQWYSKKKNPRKTCILFKYIEDIVIGQKMPKFQRHRAPELERSSFSIIYDGGKTLDLIAIQPREFKIWITGLRELLKLTGEMGSESLADVNHLYMTVKTTAKIPESERKKMLGFIPSAEGEAFPDMRRNSGHGDKQMFKEVSAEYAKIQKRLEVLEKKLGTQKYELSPQFRTMKGIIKNVQGQMKPLKDLMLDGEFKACDDKIWRASVALESLEHMMAATK
mmetsp:Transcript_19737/g.27383  ORF Transcript_19737/g.27383 Transcript_19737/m.27383 type:complete len:508 (-) Transcript_19737:73-1596(-)